PPSGPSGAVTSRDSVLPTRGSTIFTSWSPLSVSPPITPTLDSPRPGGVGATISVTNRGVGHITRATNRVRLNRDAYDSRCPGIPKLFDSCNSPSKHASTLIREHRQAFETLNIGSGVTDRRNPRSCLSGGVPVARSCFGLLGFLGHALAQGLELVVIDLVGELEHLVFFFLDVLLDQLFEHGH